MARTKDLAAQGISSLSTGHGEGGLRIRTRATDGPAGMTGRGLELTLDQGNLDWLLSHLALRPQYEGVFRAVADELAAMEAVRNDPGASVIARMRARADDLGACRRMQEVIRTVRAAQGEGKGQQQ